MIRIAGLLVAVLALVGAGGCEQVGTPVVAAPDPRIAEVEAGLSSSVWVSGEPAAAWSLAERMAFYKVPGVSIAVIKDGRIAWAKGYGVLEAGKMQPVDAATIFQAGSISKPTAGLAALRMVEQGKLKLDAPINDFLTSWKAPDNDFTKIAPVTLRGIMSHGAGFTVHGFPGYAAGAPVPTVRQVLDGEAPANTPKVRVDKTPGTSFRYSGGGYTVMQLAMTDVSGKSFPALTDELVLKPAGMTRSSYVNPLPMDNRANAATAHKRDGTVVPGQSHTYPEMAAAGLWTTPGDLSRLALAVVGSARGDKGALLGPQLTQEMLTVQMGRYGLGFDLNRGPDGQVFSHGGVDEGFEAFLFSYTDGHGGAVIMTNAQGGTRLVDEIKVSLARAYGWKYGAAEIRNAITLTPERAALFAGEYAAKMSGQPDLALTITADGNELWLEAPPFVARQRFYVASDTEAFGLATPMSKYTVDEKGRPQTFEMGGGLLAVRKK